MEPLRTRIDTLLGKHPDYDDETIAKTVVHGIRTRADLAELTMPLVVEQVANLRRRDTRTRERRVFEAAGGPVEPATELRELLDRSMMLDDGRLVGWGEATIDDHRARIAYLQRLVDGIERTIAVHRVAIATIAAAEASCLAELSDDQVAPLLAALS